MEVSELLSKLFRGFADQSRINILQLLQNGELTVGDLVEKTGLTQPNVSNHLSCLKECGLVQSEQRARFVFYRLTGAKVKRLLGAAKDLLEEVRPKIEQCANYEVSRKQRQSRGIRK